MIKSPILWRAALIYALWYVLVNRVMGHGSLPHDLAFGSAYVVVGVTFGLFATVGTEALNRYLVEREIKAGHSWGGACVTLGRLPEICTPHGPESAPSESAKET